MSSQKFDVAAFYANPAGYIGNKELRIDDAAANLTGARTQRLAVKVQKEDNSYETVTEYIDYTEIPGTSCERKLYMRIFDIPGSTSKTGYAFGKNYEGVNDSEVNAYYLPWKNGCAYAVKLDERRDYFATAQVNGCCVYVAGSRKNPLVIHANYDSERLDPSKQEVEKMSPEEYLGALSKHQLKQYTRFYGNLGHVFIDEKVIEDWKDPISIYDPEFYFSRGGAKASLFGVRKSDGWRFYYNLAKESSYVTDELWPKTVGNLP